MQTPTTLRRDFRFFKPHSAALALLALVWLFTPCAQALVTTVGFWRMGESDSGAAGGVAVSTVTDNVGAHSLVVHGNATYSTNVSVSASNALGSTLSVNLTNSAYATSSIVSTSVDNFGIECWVKPTTSGGGEVIAYNGGTGGASGSSGWGLIIAANNTYQVLYGGLTLFGTNAATPNVWTHLALVRSSGTSTLYVNGVATVTDGATIPIKPSGNFGVGAPPQSPTSQFFTGLVDEVRVFTFAPGQFSPSDLLLNQSAVLPQPTTFDAVPAFLNTASLSGAIPPCDLPGTAWFEWGTTASYGITTPPVSVPGNLSYLFPTNLISGVFSGATYHFRLVLANAAGTNASPDAFFQMPYFITNGSFNLPTLDQGSVAWGDYDNDGLLDIVMAGMQNGNPITQVWRNNGNGTFSHQDLAPGLFQSSVAWGDYDNDGFLDILVSGQNGSVFYTQVWHNNGNGTFTLLNLPLPGVSQPSVAWGDFNNDGRLDILVTGYAPTGLVAQVWQNLGNGAFSLVNSGISPTFDAAAWGDYDNDGRLDILLSGDSNSGPRTEIWRNNGDGTFSKVANAGLPSINSSHVAWGDYDNDGRLDILLSGMSGGTPITQVWHNNGDGSFSNINAGLPGISQGAVAWGDFDNDGRLDILLSGLNTNPAPVTQIWRNNGDGTFSNSNISLPVQYNSAAVWGDFEHDGRLDVLIAGAYGPMQICQNIVSRANTPPTVPTALTANLNQSGSLITFSWNASTDAEIPGTNLTYNIRIGTAPGGSQIYSSESSSDDGFRRVPRDGNLLKQLSVSIPAGIGTYYWTVQAVDNNFGGSAFPPEESFRVLPVKVPITTTTLIPGDVNLDGVVDTSDLAAMMTALGTNRVSGSNVNQVLLNYLTGDGLLMTNMAGLGSSNVMFGLSNSPAVNFTVQTSTNLINWQTLGPARLMYRFTDTNAPLSPDRQYRLVYP